MGFNSGFKGLKTTYIVERVGPFLSPDWALQSGRYHRSLCSNNVVRSRVSGPVITYTRYTLALLDRHSWSHLSNRIFGTERVQTLIWGSGGAVFRRKFLWAIFTYCMVQSPSWEVNRFSAI